MQGPGVTTGTTQALSNGVDLFATVLDLSNIAPDTNAPDRPFHSVSLGPIFNGETDMEVRDFVYADSFGTRRVGKVNLRTIRNLDYKLVIDLIAGTEELYQVKSDPNELKDLTRSAMSNEATANLAALQAELKTLLATKN